MPYPRNLKIQIWIIIGNYFELNNRILHNDDYRLLKLGWVPCVAHLKVVKKSDEKRSENENFTDNLMYLNNNIIISKSVKGTLHSPHFLLYSMIASHLVVSLVCSCPIGFLTGLLGSLGFLGLGLSRKDRGKRIKD